MTLFSADWVCPVVGHPIRDGVLRVSDDRIEAVGPSVDGEVAERAFPGCAIVPGFVNAHIHLELTLLRGLLEDLTFIDWIRTLTRTKYECMEREDLLVSARMGAVECLVAGVTAVGEVMDEGTGWEAMREFGLRGIAYQEVFGPSGEAAAESMRKLAVQLDRLPDAPAGSLQRIGVSPHAPYTVSDLLYEKVRERAEQDGLPLALHIAESREESSFVRDGGGPFADYLLGRGIAVKARDVGPIEYVGGLGLLGPQTLAIHAVDASPDDIARIRDADVAVVHCPKSNLKLGHGIAPLREFLDAGVRVGLGTDSVASNNVVDMFEEMRTAIFLQRTRLNDPRALSASEVFRMATLGGAGCLGLDSEVGSLEPGKRADFVVVDLQEPALQPVYDPIESMVFSANRRNVRQTFVGGRPVAFDSRELIEQAGMIGARLAKAKSVQLG